MSKGWRMSMTVSCYSLRCFRPLVSFGRLLFMSFWWRLFQGSLNLLVEDILVDGRSGGHWLNIINNRNHPLSEGCTGTTLRPDNINRKNWFVRISFFHLSENLWADILYIKLDESILKLRSPIIFLDVLQSGVSLFRIQTASMTVLTSCGGAL